jgi:solute carrier family 25 protein 38
VPGIAWFYAVIEKMSPKTSADRIAAGFIARSSATTVFLPLVVIKTQIEWGNGSSIGDVARRIHKSEGIAGFWRGLFPTLLRDGPYSALYVLFYKSLQDSFGSERARYEVQKSSFSTLFFSINFLLGILAGASAVILTQPADVLRCHLQIDQRIGLENFKSHIRERGVLKALYLDGIGPRITRRTLVSAINWTIFEELKRRL